MQRQKTAQYYPWNPGFAAYGTHSKIYPIPSASPIGDMVCQIYEIAGCKEEQALLSAIPDGCHDFIFLCSPKGIQGFFSVSIDAPRQFQFAEGSLLLGVRFLPGATFALYRENIASHMDSPLPLDALFPKSNLLAEALFAADSFEKRHEMLLRFLQMHRLAENGQQTLLRHCIARILCSHGQCTVAELAQDTGYSTRYIQDLFQKSVGNSPKLLGKTIRMQRAASLLLRQKQLPLCEIAAECGYADQSHMYRDFMQLTCHAPKQIRESGTLSLPQNHVKITQFH